MKIWIALFYLFIQCNASFCQIDLEHQLHMQSYDRVDTNRFFSNRKFSNYLIDKVLKNKSDSVFISNKSLLKNIPITSVDACKTFSFNDCTFENKIKLSVIYDSSKGTFLDVNLDLNGNIVSVPSEELQSFKSPLRCEGLTDNSPVEVCKSLIDGYIYVYLYGGKNADQWISKLVFDDTRFICAITANYYDLSINGCFSESFKGY